MVESHVIVILALLEVIFVAMGFGGFLFVRTRSQRRQILDLEHKLANPPEPKIVTQSVPVQSKEPVVSKSFEDYLREEIDNSNVLLGDSDGLERLDTEPVDENDEDVELRNMLAMRHQFLQLELDAQALSNDPEARRKHMLDGMRSLVSALTPEPVIKEVPAEVTEDNVRSREQQLQDQIEALRTAVNNQHDVMAELRRILKERLGDSKDAQIIIAEIEKAEAEAEKLEASLSELRKPSAAHESGMAGGKSGFSTVDDADTDMLKNLVGNQQNTINKLKHMLAEAIPDAKAAEDLKQAVDKVQRANQELGTCVMVLEDENSRLRTEVETLEAKMHDIEERPSASAATESEAENLSASSEEEENFGAAWSGGTAVSGEVSMEAEAAIDVVDSKALPEENVEVDEVESESDEWQQADIETAVVDKETTEPEPEVEPDQAELTDETVAEGATSIDDIDALLQEVAIAEPMQADTPAAEETVDSLLDEVKETESQSEPEPEWKSDSDPESEGEGTNADDIDALLDEVAAAEPEAETDATVEQSEEAVKAEETEGSCDTVSDEDDLDALLQDVAAASQAEADATEQQQETMNTEEAMDEVDALLAEIAADNKKTNG